MAYESEKMQVRNLLAKQGALGTKLILNQIRQAKLDRVDCGICDSKSAYDG